ncbi:hypothetical protein L1987_32395 [Smallanthus sonchifolius]|uniref:Uncharacterized protein n=3 Tax=Smallanthus sonchifolius TaxID=185202 RepID=A0ACB9HPF6_9ASTR|nr:hypothetical protein L1987_32391 [Smallanthus sonchifolius]KAI3797140.1 hypothetical protein L1987_32393 [Smallanthus sonchifolius]KAI3797142.1 hypothetical protein L1987_32395 [Smallanthus sonchifolius]
MQTLHSDEAFEQFYKDVRNRKFPFEEENNEDDCEARQNATKKAKIYEQNVVVVEKEDSSCKVFVKVGWFAYRYLP